MNKLFNLLTNKVPINKDIKFPNSNKWKPVKGGWVKTVVKTTVTTIIEGTTTNGHNKNNS